MINKRFVKQLVFTSLFLLVFQNLIFSQLFEDEKKVELTDDRESWKVGVTQFYDRGVTPELSYLLKSIPLVLYEKIKNCESHLLTQNEISFLSKKRIEKELLDKKVSLSGKQKELDELFFDRNATAEKKKAIQTQIRTLYLEIEKLRLFEATPDKVAVETEKSIELVIVSEESPLLINTAGSPAQIIMDNKLDMLVTGRVEQVEGLIYYRIELYNRHLAEPLIIRLNGAEYSKLDELIEEDSKEIVATVLGREWSNIIIETWPLTAVIRFSDGEKGVGIISRTYMEPGTYLVRLDAPGFISEEIEVILHYGEKLDYKLRMQKDLNYPVVLQSYPAGADIYLSSEWVGKTPMLVENGGFDEPFVIRKEGYTDFYGTLEEQEMVLQNITLLSSDFMTASLLEQKRDDMYNSLTMMAIGVPFFLFGLGFNEKFEDTMAEMTSKVSSTTTVDGVVTTSNNFSKDYYDLSTSKAGMTLLNEIGFTLFASSIINLFIDMVQYVNVYDNM